MRAACRSSNVRPPWFRFRFRLGHDTGLTRLLSPSRSFLQMHICLLPSLRHHQRRPREQLRVRNHIVSFFILHTCVHSPPLLHVCRTAQGPVQTSPFHHLLRLPSPSLQSTRAERLIMIQTRATRAPSTPSTTIRSLHL